MQVKAKIWFKLIVSIIILCLLFYSIDVDLCLKTLSLISIKIFLLLVLIYIAGQIISAFKWKIIANKLSFSGSFFSFIKFYFKGMFYNSFLPTNVGGDIMKMVYLRDCNNLENPFERAFVSVIFDRFSGVFVLICLAFFGIFCFEGLCNILKYLIIAGFITTLICIGIVAILIKCKNNIKNFLLTKIINYSSLFFNKSIVPVLLLSLVFHILVICIHILIGKDLHLDINSSYYLILYPLTAFAASLPISFNGIGIKEAAYIYILNLINITPSVAIVFVLCWNLVILVTSLLGTLFFIQKNR